MLEVQDRLKKINDLTGENKNLSEHNNTELKKN